MTILAVDTCSNSMSCAVGVDSNIIGEIYLNVLSKHTVTLMPTVDKLLNACGVDVESIDCFACTTGPGSFTGQRIGIATVLGLADAQGKPVFGVSTVEILSMNVALNNSIICPIMDARNNQVYTALYQYNDNELVELEVPIAIDMDDWLEIIEKRKDNIVFVGDAQKFEYKIVDYLGTRALFSANNAIRASSIVKMASKKTQKWISTLDLKPIYLRKSQAERMRG